MGVKGRNLLYGLYLFTGLAALLLKVGGYETPARWMLVLMGVLITSIGAFYYRVRAARKESRTQGLKLLFLLPVSRSYIRALLALSDDQLDQPFQRAYEIHINTHQKLPLNDFTQQLKEDLAYLKNHFNQTLFVWETNVPLPLSFRQLIKEAEKRNQAFWKKGRWPGVAPTFASRPKHKYTRRGAFLLNENSKGGSII
ncbi:hypothetical protein V6C32_10850 [Desulforamulus ruminis]|uniref:hypothetical protein n=1 Tax=Desulforamulus ruminis TaxID=1564 RepID=UPI002FDA9A22